MAWSRKHKKCKNCGTSSKAPNYGHVGNGLCARCYRKQYKATHKAKFDEYGERYYKKSKQLIIEKNRARRELENFDNKYSQILERDKYKCTICSGGSSGLVVHHKDGTGVGSEVHNNSDSNLQTLCRACHMDAHREKLNEAIRDSHRKRKTQ